MNRKEEILEYFKNVPIGEHRNTLQISNKLNAPFQGVEALVRRLFNEGVLDRKICGDRSYVYRLKER